MKEGYKLPSVYFSTRADRIESQNRRLKSHLLQGRSIDPIQALAWYGIMRLSGRIYDLRREGMNIVTTRVHVKNKTYARYSLTTK